MKPPIHLRVVLRVGPDFPVGSITGCGVHMPAASTLDPEEVTCRLCQQRIINDVERELLRPRRGGT